MKKCQYCSEEIQNEAKKCRFCGEWIEKNEMIQSNNKTESLELLDDNIDLNESNISNNNKSLWNNFTDIYKKYSKLFGRLIFILILIILSIYGGEEDKIYNEAKKLFGEKNYDSALIKYDELIKEYPNNYLGYNDKSLILYKKRQFQEALNTINKINTSNISSKDIYILGSIESNKCLYYQDLNQLEEAEKHCNAALTYFPKDSLALNNKAIILESYGKYTEALDLINKSIEYWDLPENKIEGYGTLDGIDIAYNAKGLILFDLERNEEGLEFLNKAIEINPNNAYAYSNKALILSKLGNNEEALIEINKALESEQFEGTMNQVKGYILSELGKDEEAIIYFDKALEFNPNDFITNYSKALSLSILGKSEDAYILAEKISELEYNESEKLYVNENIGLKCISLIDLERYNDGLIECNNYLNNYGKDFSESKTYIMNYKGFALISLGKEEDAIKVFEEILKIEPTNEMANTFLYGE